MPDIRSIVDRVRSFIITHTPSEEPSRSLFADIGLAVVALSVTWTIVGTPAAVLTILWSGLSGIPDAYSVYGSVLLGGLEPPIFWAVATGFPLVLARVMPTRRAFGIAFGILSVARGLGSGFESPGATLGILLFVYLLVWLFAGVLARVEDVDGGVTAIASAEPAAEPAADGGQPADTAHGADVDVDAATDTDED